MATDRYMKAVLSVIALALVWLCLWGPKPKWETPAEAASTQVISGRYLPVVRRDWLIIVDTRTGKAWKEVMNSEEEGGGTLLQRFERIGTAGKPE